jgi:hypothetical protein
MQFEKMADIIPEGRAENAEIKHLEITKEDALLDSMRSMSKGYVPVTPGKMCRLFVMGNLMMSDGPDEHRTNIEVVRRAHGDVLIAGLGIGMVLLPILQKKDVESVTVIEKYIGVYSLVAHHIRNHAGEDGKKLKFDIADIYLWTPPKDMKYDTIYFDIWTSVSPDDIAGMTKLKRKFARRLNRDHSGAWMGCWCEKT